MRSDIWYFFTIFLAWLCVKLKVVLARLLLGEGALLQGGVEVGVAHDVAGAARGDLQKRIKAFLDRESRVRSKSHFVYVHVQPPLLVPGEQPVVVVDLKEEEKMFFFLRVLVKSGRVSDLRAL